MGPLTRLFYTASTPSAVTSSLFLPARTFSTASARFSSRLSVPLAPRIASRTTPTSTPIPHQPPLFSQSTPRKYSTMSDHGNVINITSDAEFKEKVLSSQGPVVVDCFATWCGPCKAIAPKVADFSKQYTNVKFYQIDVDELSNTAGEIGVRAMPTFLLYKDGEKVEDVVGANPAALEAAIKKLAA